MQLTNKQEQGLKIALEKYRNNEKYVVISGYAGTGKTTLVSSIIDALSVESSKVAYVAFTGKAAEVLRKKGNPNAMTLTKLLYESVPRAGGGFTRIPKKEISYSILVVDEVSMVPMSMIKMLLSHRAFIIFLGDPFQLPQIDKKEAHTLLDKPDVFLDEIMRQAADSDIIQLTMKIRNFESIDYFQSKEVLIINNDMSKELPLTWADQIICATNAKRTDLNKQLRSIYGFNGLPQDGEKMICLRNYWDDISDNGTSSLVNGITGIIHNPYETFRDAPKFLKLQKYRYHSIAVDFETDDGVFKSVNMDKDMILTGKKCVEWRDEYALGKMRHKIGDILPREFDFGYAITCHKAQGSEWDKVLVYEESFPFDKIEHARWLYTAATRASEKLILVR